MMVPQGFLSSIADLKSANSSPVSISRSPQNKNSNKPQISTFSFCMYFSAGRYDCSVYIWKDDNDGAEITTPSPDETQQEGEPYGGMKNNNIIIVTYLFIYLFIRPQFKYKRGKLKNRNKKIGL